MAMVELRDSFKFKKPGRESYRVSKEQQKQLHIYTRYWPYWPEWPFWWRESLSGSETKIHWNRVSLMPLPPCTEGFKRNWHATICPAFFCRSSTRVGNLVSKVMMTLRPQFLIFFLSFFFFAMALIRQMKLISGWFVLLKCCFSTSQMYGFWCAQLDHVPVLQKLTTPGTNRVTPKRVDVESTLGRQGSCQDFWITSRRHPRQ